jgi:predicted RNA binding protein YcfA (HicA-like mRNA interferase family)
LSERLPRITAAELLRALHRDGWYQDHQRGSHVYLRHPDRPGLVTVPMHAGRTLKPKTLSSILDQAGIDVERLRTLL